MKQKKVVWAIVFLLTLQLVLGLGVIPAKTIVDLSNAEIYEGKITVVNNDHLKTVIKLSAEENIRDYITFEEDSFMMQKNDEEKTIGFTISLPLGLNPEGMLSNIIITQEVDDHNKIEVAVSLKHKLILSGPVPEKYVKTTVYSHVDGDNLNLVSELTNLGRLDLDKVRTIFYVTKSNGGELTTKTDETGLSVGETKNLDAQLSLLDLGEGEFDIIAVTQFGGAETKTTEKINLGEKDLVVADLDPVFKANDFNEINLRLRNTWNKETKDVYVNLELLKGNEVVISFQTASIDIPALSEKELKQYFNAENIIPGEYNLRLTKYEEGNNLGSETFSVKFLTPEDYNKLFDPSKNISSPETKQFSFAFLIIPILLIGLLFLALIYKFKHKKKKDDFYTKKF